MAVIPRLDAAEVQTSALPTPQMRPGQAGAALGELGRAVSGVGNDMFQHAMEQKHFADSSAVMEAQTSLNSEVMQLHSFALSRQGHDALDNNDTYGAFDSTYKRHVERLKNDTQRRMFAQQTANDRNQFSLSIERHAAEQGKMLGQTNATALVETDMQKLSTLYRDPQAFDQQLKVAQAHTLDMLHMHGIADTDPAAVEKLAEVKSKAYVDRIKQTMVENAPEAQHLFEVHQDEIAVHEREGLKHTITIKNDEHLGMAAADKVSPLILKGDKTETDIVQMVRNDPSIKDNPAARRHAEQQVRSDYAVAKNSRAELVGDLGAAVEKAINAGIANDKPMTPKELANLPEYNALIKNGSKEALAEASRFMGQTYRDKRESEREQHQLEREQKSDAAERRREQHERERERKQSQLELTAAYDDPDLLTNASVGQIKALGPQIGYANVVKLVNQRSKYLKDDSALQRAKVDRDVLVNEMTDAGMKYVINPSKAGSDDYKATTKVKAKVEQQMRYEAERGGKPVTPERQREIVREQLLKVHVTKRSMLGAAGERVFGIPTEEVPQYAAKADNYDFPGVPTEDVAMVVTALRSRGLSEPTYEQVRRGLAAFKGK